MLGIINYVLSMIMAKITVPKQKCAKNHDWVNVTSDSAEVVRT